MQRLCLVLILCCTTQPALAKNITLTQALQSDLHLNLSPHNLTLILDSRTLGPISDNDSVTVEDISQKIQPQSLQILNAGTITEQSVNNNPINFQQLMDQHIGRNITLATRSATGAEKKQLVKLLSADANTALVENQGAIETIPLHSQQWRLIFPKSSHPPRLNASLSFKSHGKKNTSDILLSYLSEGLFWKMDYALVLNSKGDKLQLQGIASLFNNTATTFNNAQITLNSTDIALSSGKNRSQAKLPIKINDLSDSKAYKLPQRTSLPSNQPTQIPIIEARDIKLQTGYRYKTRITRHRQTSRALQHPNYYLSFSNTQNNKLGKALPPGHARIFMTDSNAQLQLVGTSYFPESNNHQSVELTTGKAPDLTIRQRQTGIQDTFDGTIITTEFIFKNSAKVQRRLTLSSIFEDHWQIISSTYPAAKKLTKSAIWDIPLRANSSLVFTLKTRLRHAK